MDPLPMRKLTNGYQDLEMFNLGINGNGKGPYLVRQVGYPPGSIQMKVDPYILQNDGVWIISYHFATLPEEEQRQRLFQSRKEVVEILDRIGHMEVRCINTLPEELSNEEILRRVKESGARLLRFVSRDKAQSIPQPPKA